MEEDKKLNNVIKFLEEHRLGRKFTEDELYIIEKVYYLARQHQFDEMMDIEFKINK
jgi:hypothetical protein